MDGTSPWDAPNVQVLSSTLTSLNSSPSKTGSWPFKPTRMLFCLIWTSSCLPRVPAGTGTVTVKSESVWRHLYGSAAGAGCADQRKTRRDSSSPRRTQSESKGAHVLLVVERTRSSPILRVRRAAVRVPPACVSSIPQLQSIGPDRPHCRGQSCDSASSKRTNRERTVLLAPLALGLLVVELFLFCVRELRCVGGRHPAGARARNSNTQRVPS